ncbi:MAG: hypothetical protein OWS74_05775, partial [Firmicutes bacterium]|nr:hypothetical protein [Bacillota bacterium]
DSDARVTAVWKLYSDVTTWPWWDLSIAHVDLPQGFAIGSTGEITLKNQSSQALRLIAVLPMQGFTEERQAADSSVIWEYTHRLRVIENGRIRITHHLKVAGEGADAVEALSRAALQEQMRGALDALALQALSDA